MLVAEIVVAAIAVLHVGILVVEMFFWDQPLGKKVFGSAIRSKEFAAQTKVLAANQGLYNGFLAAGLFWGLWLGPQGDPVKFFFLACVFVAGAYGAVSVDKKILFVQSVPATIAMALLWLSI
ncbi:MAG: DUF1304 domain-containing protein [Moraxellaceae bacterium]|nr:DUF1304 domain-containing protein [Moraxellaceae bacterium]MDZ4386294.1 DUF1304 domain-containing protein [Moraxellaceae bacterium]